jgi:hypothetical protein
MAARHAVAAERHRRDCGCDIHAIHARDIYSGGAFQHCAECGGAVEAEAAMITLDKLHLNHRNTASLIYNTNLADHSAI